MFEIVSRETFAFTSVFELVSRETFACVAGFCLPLRVFLPPLSPRPPFPLRGKGGNPSYIMQGASPLATPGLRPCGAAFRAACSVGRGVRPAVSAYRAVCRTGRGLCPCFSGLTYLCKRICLLSPGGVRGQPRRVDWERLRRSRRFSPGRGAKTARFQRCFRHWRRDARGEAPCIKSLKPPSPPGKGGRGGRKIKQRMVQSHC